MAEVQNVLLNFLGNSNAKWTLVKALLQQCCLPLKIDLVPVSENCSGVEHSLKKFHDKG